MGDENANAEPSRAAVTEWNGGISWIANPDEDGQRASHALATDAGVWVVDPVDADGIDERVRELGSVAGVVVTQDRHTRDAEAVAERHGVPVSVPEWMELVREKLDAEPESVGETLPGTAYAVRELIRTDEWEEAVLINGETGTLVVPEAVGTLPPFGGDALGVHPALEEPPAGLSDARPERILVGHGSGVHEGADAALRAVFDAE